MIHRYYAASVLERPGDQMRMWLLLLGDAGDECDCCTNLIKNTTSLFSSAVNQRQAQALAFVGTGQVSIVSLIYNIVISIPTALNISESSVNISFHKHVFV